MPNQDLLARLETIRGNYTIGLMFCGLLRNPSTRESITANRVFLLPTRTIAFIPGQPIQFQAGDPYIELKLGGPADLSGMNHMIDQFSAMLLRNLIQDTFELIRNYCKATNQLDKIKSQPWYHFARLLRNAVTHDQCWKFEDYERSLLPVTWRGKSITADMEGQDLQTAFFGWFDRCQLFEEMYHFARTLT